MIILIGIYILCVAALFYSYVLYPIMLRWMSNGKHLSNNCYSPKDKLPEVYMIFSVYNGDKVLREKIESMLNSDYPSHLLHVIVGSDESTDNTDSIVSEIASRDIRVQLQRYSRRGKSNVINAISQNILSQGVSDDAIFVLTDAYAIFEKQTLFEMVKLFKEERIGIVGANYINTNLQAGGISHQEKAYIQRENLIKYQEGVSLGSMMGVYGACYAIRAKDFPEFPGNILMEDFYVTMLMLQQGKQSVLNLESRFYENIPNSIEIEFRRKKRISAGNFQNLVYFKSLLSPKYGGTALAFWSHKVLRWLGPFFILISYAACFLLACSGHAIFQWVAIGHLLLLVIPPIDSLLKRIGVNFALFRFVTYFLGMNLAILAGLKWYLEGIETNVWQPTARS
ncbi:MAG: glycosyltransferase [Bacteroidetes bacterium]|nr:glycosyltransferase [Bacteroidota bacterium]